MLPYNKLLQNNLSWLLLGPNPGFKVWIIFIVRETTGVLLRSQVLDYQRLLKLDETWTQDTGTTTGSWPLRRPGPRRTSSWLDIFEVTTISHIKTILTSITLGIRIVQQLDGICQAPAEYRYGLPYPKCRGRGQDIWTRITIILDAMRLVLYAYNYNVRHEFTRK